MTRRSFCCFLISIALLFSPAAVLAAQYNNQDVTAYTAGSGARTFHGTYPSGYYTAAVHPQSCGSPTSGTLFPFGAIIHTDTALHLPGYGYRETFRVEDMGDVYCRQGLTRQWFDIYFGLKGTTADQHAIQFGLRKANYNVY